MKRYFLILTLAILCMPEVFAQYNYRMEGKCGLDVKWSFDGVTLVISNVNKKGLPMEMDDYDISQRIAPWAKKKLNIRKVQIQRGIKNIGSCAFANCPSLQEVIFIGNDVESIDGAHSSIAHIFVASHYLLICVILRLLHLPTAHRCHLPSFLSVAV